MEGAMSGKGDRQRRKQLSNKENDLRWELLGKGITPERKEQILAELEELKHLPIPESDNKE